MLVLEAGAMGSGGEIFVFDMGKSVKIVDLAKKMIMLSGYKPFSEIDIVYTGLRKGEKLYEELLASKEDTIQTHHNKIMIARVREYSYEQINSRINTFISLLEEGVKFKMVTLMKEIVPEFKSMSSPYKELDKKVTSVA